MNTDASLPAETEASSICLGQLVHAYVDDAGSLYDIATCSKCKYSYSSIIDGGDFKHEEKCNQLVRRPSTPEYDENICSTIHESTELLAVSCDSDGASGDFESSATTLDSCPLQLVRGSHSPVVTGELSSTHDESDMEHLVSSGMVSGKLDRSITIGSFSDLSHERLKYARRKFLEMMCCPTCSCLGYELTIVEGDENVLTCPKCCQVYGLDDSVNYYDLLMDLEEGRFLVEPCLRCGNADPNKFTVVLRDDRTDSEQSFGFKCMSCCSDQSSNADSELCEGTSLSVASDTHELSTSEDMEVDLIECATCGNYSKDLFEVVQNAAGGILCVKCHLCDSRSKVPHAKCICGDADYHELVFDVFGYLCKNVCRRCHAECELGAWNSTPRVGSDGSALGRTQIMTLALLKRGDHIAWHQPLSYWHHAIVEYVDEQTNRITIINYNGPNKHKGEIVRQSKDVNLATEQLYRIDYDVTECYHPDKVIARAINRLGETKYSLLWNNCEHFARWCKTDASRSSQSESFFRTIKNRAFTMISTSYQLISSVGNSKIGDKLVRVVVKDVLASADPAGKAVKAAVGDSTKRDLSAVVSSGLSVGRFLPAAFIVGAEICMVYRDLNVAMQRRRDGHIERNEFIKICIKRVVESGGSLAGVAVAIPLTMSSVGLTLGAIIGQGFGSLVGRQCCVIYDKVANTH